MSGRTLELLRRSLSTSSLRSGRPLVRSRCRSGPIFKIESVYYFKFLIQTSG